MQLSCLPVSFFPDIIAGRMSVGEWARMAAEIGLDAIDASVLFFPDRSPAALAAARREIEDAGMSLTMLCSYTDFTHPDAAQRRRELEMAREVVEMAAALGSRTLRVTAGQAHPQTGREEGIAWAVEGLTALVESTRDSGVALLYENHSKPGAWQYTDFSTPHDIFLAVAEGTAEVGLGINFDTANATAFSPDALALLERVLGRVVTVHAADTSAIGKLQPVLLGTGLVRFDPLLRRLRGAGWDGWICIEEASFGGRAGVEAAARFIRRAWAAAE